MGDITDLDETYDVAIIDLPYNILSRFDETAQDKIIHHASRIAGRMVFVSSSSIKDSLDIQSKTVLIETN